jgi:hypothetical protein
MQRAYLGLQGVAAGPIRIGPSGAWIVDSTNTVNRSVYHSIAIVNKPHTGEGVSFIPLRAGLASTEDDYGVVTVEYLKTYHPSSGSGTSVDLSKYTTKTEYQDLYKIVMGPNTSYSNANSIEVRVTSVENQIAGVTQTSQATSDMVASMKADISQTKQDITTLGARIDSLTFDPFAGGALLKAGGA